MIVALAESPEDHLISYIDTFTSFTVMAACCQSLRLGGCLTALQRRLVGYREDLIVLWHQQNDIIAVRFHDNNNLESSCINIELTSTPWACSMYL